MPTKFTQSSYYESLLNKFSYVVKNPLPMISRTGLLLLLLTSHSMWTQVTFEREIMISDKGLFFDGVDVGASTSVPNRGPAYDFAFGSRITPHGDCIKEYQGFVFMTWYRGGKEDRHVMLSRYNPNTGTIRTIEFPHRHTGFQNVPHIGESHNTIAVGISPLDGTIHLLYDMHSYSENRPSNGSLADDYFRYSYSVKNAATVPDNEFNLSQFVNDSEGDYKHLEMRPGTDYRSLTYPNFFLNTRGELFMWIREGGNTNGAYKFCKYDGNEWSDFTSFNVMNASRNGNVSHNWGLYGDIKFESGKMRIGFARRSGNRNDRFQLNNGFYYGYSDDPNGLQQWKDHNDRPFTIPLLDSERIKASEPTDVLGLSAPNSILMTSGADWTVTDNGDIHSVTSVGTGRDKRAVHTFKKAGDTEFQTSTDFPGGDLYTFKNEVYLIGLGGGRIFVEKTIGGTNNWERIYQSTRSKRFRHGNVYISDEGKLYFYLMERLSGSAQPIYLQILDLGLAQDPENELPAVTITAPANNSTFSLGEEITIAATVEDADGSIDRVNFKINDNFYRSDLTAPYAQTFAPESAGTYKLAARAIDDDLGITEVFITVNVVDTENRLPEVNMTAPTDGQVYQLGEEINMAAAASDPDGAIDRIHFKINDDFYRNDPLAPYSQNFVPEIAGSYKLAARAFDNEGGSAEVFVTVTVADRENRLPEVAMTSPLEGAVYFLGEEITLAANASDLDGNIDRVNFKVNDDFYRTDPSTPYLQTFAPESAGTYKLAARAFDNDGGFTEVFVTVTVMASDNQLPEVVMTSPLEGAVYLLGEDITLAANASDPDGSIDRVNFKVNDDFYRSEPLAPYARIFSPENAGTYKLAARAFDNDGGSTEVFVNINVVESENQLPSIQLTSPREGEVFVIGEEITMAATVTDSDGNIDRVHFNVDDVIYRSDATSPYIQTFTPDRPGNYKLAARAFDNEDASREDFVHVTVIETDNIPPEVVMNSPLQGATYTLGEEITMNASATDADGNVDRVHFKVNDDFYAADRIAPYQRIFVPDSASTYKLAVRAFDDIGSSSEVFVTVNVVEGENELPSVIIEQPLEGANFLVGEEVTINVSAMDSDGTITKLDFKVDDSFFASDNTTPYSQTFVPERPGTYRLSVQAFDNDGGATEVFTSINVLDGDNQLPLVSFTIPEGDIVLEDNYDELYVSVRASDQDGFLTSVSLFLSDNLIRTIEVPPYEWGANDFVDETLGLPIGEHVFKAVAIDNDGGVSEAFFNATIHPITNPDTDERAGTFLYPNPARNAFSLYGTPQKFGTMTILDMSGKIIMQRPVKDIEEPYDTSFLSSGLFIVKLEYENEIISMKLLLRK